jgi:hypothetical protein
MKYYAALNTAEETELDLEVTLRGCMSEPCFITVNISKVGAVRNQKKQK